MYSAKDHFGYPVLVSFGQPFSGNKKVVLIYPELSEKIEISFDTFSKFFSLEDGLN